MTSSEWLEIIFIIVIVSIQIAVALRIGRKLRTIRNFVPDGASLKLKSYYVDGSKLKSLTVEDIIASERNKTANEEAEKQNPIYSRGTIVDSDGDAFFASVSVPEEDALFKITPKGETDTDGELQLGYFVPFLPTDDKIEMFASHPDQYLKSCEIKVQPSVSNSFTVLAKGEVAKEKGSDRWRITAKCHINIHYKGKDDE